MTPAHPSDVDALRAALAVAGARAGAMAAEAAAARAEADASVTAAIIATLNLEIEKLRRALYGQRSERQARFLDQLELQLEEIEADLTEDELAAGAVATKPTRARCPRRPVGIPDPSRPRRT